MLDLSRKTGQGSLRSGSQYRTHYYFLKKKGFRIKQFKKPIQQQIYRPPLPGGIQEQQREF